MKTVFIYDDQSATEPIKFFVAEGDYSHLNKVYINASDNQYKVDELNSILFDDTWNYKVNLLKEFPVHDFNPNIDKVIVVGFI